MQVFFRFFKSFLFQGIANSWSAWAAWGNCSASCGYGTAARNRTCLGCVGGCPGNATSSQTCIITSCPVDCQLSWGAWSSCSASCGTGTQIRQQYVSQPALYGGASCPMPLVDIQPCIMSACNDCAISTNGPNALPCFNNGVCNDSVAFDGHFTCSCPSGFTGDNCQNGSS